MAGMKPRFLSADTNGEGILIAATASAGTLLHTSVAGTTQFDEVFLYAHNTHTAPVDLTIEFGGTATKNLIKKSIPFGDGLYLVIPGLKLQNGKTVAAFASIANVINIHGWAHRADL